MPTPSRPPIVVVHGALGAAAQMAPVADALRTLGDVTVVELPGHGATPLGDESFSIAGFARALARVVRTLPAPPLVFGHSMGGYVALALESSAPGTCAGIVTLGTKMDWSPGVAAREAGKCDAAVIEAKVPRFARLLEARHEGSGGWQLLLERTAGMIHALGAAPVLGPGPLGRVRCPAVLAVGEADDTVSVDETRAAASLMPAARAEQLGGTPHPIERVPPEAITALVGSLRAPRT
jgi:pimeloyl-ACP methyl ester carboxylesterase